MRILWSLFVCLLVFMLLTICISPDVQEKSSDILGSAARWLSMTGDIGNTEDVDPTAPASGEKDSTEILNPDNFVRISRRDAQRQRIGAQRTILDLLGPNVSFDKRGCTDLAVGGSVLICT